MEKAWKVVNKMVRNGDFDHSSQELLYPNALQVVRESAEAQYSVMQDEPHTIDVLINCITFINHHFQVLVFDAQQQPFVKLVFQGIARWQQLVLEQHAQGGLFFQAICKLFRTVLKQWAPKVYTSIDLMSDSRRNTEFAFQRALLKASQMVPPPDSHPNHYYQDVFMNMRQEDDEERKSPDYDSEDRSFEEEQQSTRVSGFSSKTRAMKAPPQHPPALSPVQMEILETFDHILMLSVDLFSKIDDVKMQTLICGQFSQYQEMILRKGDSGQFAERFLPQLETMTMLALKRLRYPEWFDLAQAEGGGSEDEEKYLELRQELTQFLEGFMSRTHFVQLIVNFADQLISEAIVNGPGEVRDLDLVFKLLGILAGTQHKRGTKEIMDISSLLSKYGFLLFSERIQNPDCSCFSDIVLSIYFSVDLKSLTKEQTIAVLTYLFSSNGILSPIASVKQQSSQLFLMWYKDRNQSQPAETLPYVEHFLMNLAPLIIQRISTSNIASFSKLYEALGNLLSDPSHSIPIAQRLQCVQGYLQTLFKNITESPQVQVTQNNLTALHYIMKGLQPDCQQDILAVFSNLLDALLGWYIASHAHITDKTGVQII